jgi:ketosteroid isomerase-like protein
MKLQDAIPDHPDRARGQLGFARALGAGDLDAAAACFARDACLITPDATAVHGRERIRPLLAQLISREIEVDVELSNVVGGGDVVMATERWRVRLGSGGARFAQTINPTLVLRQIESEWKLAIAAPWGWAERGL